MEVIHHGGHEGVTGSCHQLRFDNGKSLLVDCGLFQGEDADRHPDLEIEFSLDGIGKADRVRSQRTLGNLSEFQDDASKTPAVDLPDMVVPGCRSLPGRMRQKPARAAEGPLHETRCGCENCAPIRFDGLYVASGIDGQRHYLRCTEKEVWIETSQDTPDEVAVSRQIQAAGSADDFGSVQGRNGRVVLDGMVAALHPVLR